MITGLTIIIRQVSASNVTVIEEELEAETRAQRARGEMLLISG